MLSYDPLQAPDARAWLELDEAERLEQVITYHHRHNIQLPNPQLHATVQVIVENQLALNDPPNVRATLDRLMRDGLDRHDTVHVIATVVTESARHHTAPTTSKLTQSCLD